MVRILLHARILVVYSQIGPNDHILENHMKLIFLNTPLTKLNSRH